MLSMTTNEGLVEILETNYRRIKKRSTENERHPEILSHMLLPRILENVIRNYIAKSHIGSLTNNYVESLIDKAIDSGIIIPIERRYKYEIPKVDPLLILKNKAIVGVDGGGFAIKLHPMRIILAKSAVFFHSQHPNFNYDIKGVWRTSVAILRRTGNVEEQLRIKMREMLVDVEVQTVKEIAEEYGGFIDAIFWDGPLYTSRYMNKFYSAVKTLTNRAIICIKSVKNSFASRIARVSDAYELTDADLYVTYLNPNQRSSAYIYNGNLVSKLPEDMKPVFFYVKSPQKIMLRYEFPYWVIEEFGLDYVLNLIYADMALGDGISYVISRADNLARFSDQERRYLIYRVLRVLKESGVDETILFNERRWARFFSEGRK